MYELIHDLFNIIRISFIKAHSAMNHTMKYNIIY
jgi:hypothetical protein